MRFTLTNILRSFLVSFGGGLSAAIAVCVILYIVGRLGNSPGMTKPAPLYNETASYGIDKVIAAVKRDLISAQLHRQEDSEGPAFFIRDFDLEVNVEITGQLTSEADLPSIKVSGAVSGGKTQLVRLHFESIGYDIAKLIIERCAQLHLLPPLPQTKPDESPPLVLPKEAPPSRLQGGELPEGEMDSPQTRFTRCVEGRMPRDINSFIYKMMKMEKAP